MISVRQAVCAVAASMVIASSTFACDSDTWCLTTATPVLARGVRATACLGLLDGLDKVTLRAGRCPGGVEPLVGLIIAIPGDRVDVIPGSGLQANGVMIPDTLPLAQDRNGRPMPVLEAGRYDLQVGQYWIRGMSGDSVDSRYVGPFGEDDIVSTAVPGSMLVKPRKRYQPVEQ